VQLADAAVFDAARAGEPAQTIGGIYDALLSTEPDAVRGFVCDASFFDVGTAADYWRTSLAFAGQAGTVDAAGRSAQIAQTARVTRSILWDDVSVAAGAIVDECIVTDGVTISAGAEYRRAILTMGHDGELRTTNLEL
jgi:NDP-sugar pyrophosphorylase family protein